MNKGVRIATICFGGVGAAVLIVAYLHPVSSGSTKAAVLLGAAMVWLRCLSLIWKSKGWRMVWLTASMVLVVPLLLPAKPVDARNLREDYLKRMKGMEGTRYVWGGENRNGIDCSGLPRRALREALLIQGLREWNGRAIRTAAEHWWFDASARALAAGYRSYAVPLGHTGTIWAMPYSSLSPGDFAVTDDGRHVLIYVGGDEWIQADPGEGRVLTLNGRTDSNPWFEMPVAMYRWSVLESE